MSKHSKNVTASAVLTATEREKLKSEWGSKEQRLGRDSLRDIDACCLCLQTVDDPVSCLQGHLFCKGCIYEYLLAQKKDLQRQQEAYEAQQKRAEGAEDSQKQKEKEQLMERFDRAQAGLLPVYVAPINPAHHPNRSRPELTTPLAPAQTVAGNARAVEEFTGFVSDDRKKEEEDARKVMEELSTKYVLDARNKAKLEMRAYWAPQNTPGTVETRVPEPAKDPCCPMDKKTLKLKQLVPVKFTEGREVREGGSKVNSGAYQCPSCFKTLAKGMKVTLIRPSGAVMCEGCVKKFVKPDMKCFVTGIKVADKDLITIQTEGTGYASNTSADPNKLVAKKYTPQIKLG